MESIGGSKSATAYLKSVSKSKAKLASFPTKALVESSENALPSDPLGLEAPVAIGV